MLSAHICMNMREAYACWSLRKVIVILIIDIPGCSLQLEELQKVKIPTSIKVTPIRGGMLDNWD